MEYPHIRGLTEWKPLARGGVALVWQARHLVLNRPVAVKVYQPESADEEHRRFLQEAAAAGSLSDHPGIVSVYDAGILPDDRPYLVMKLCPGGSLTQWLRPENRPSEERVRQVGVRIADALAAAHATGVLHRDVKPANILLDRFGDPVLADFGLAAVPGAEAAAADALGVTPAYAPPEAFLMRPVSGSGDVFSLAATLYALLAGRRPRGEDAPTVALEQMAKVAKLPIDPIPGVDWYLMDVLMTALSNDPEARPTAAEFRDQLAALPRSHNTKRPPFIAGSPADLQRVPGPASATGIRWGGKRGARVLVLSAALVAVCTSTAAWLIGDPGTQTATPGVLASSASPSRAFAARSPSSTPAPTGDDDKAGARSPKKEAPRKETIVLQVPADSAKPFETVRIRGTYRAGADTFLQVQRWEGGRWQGFPVPTSTDKSGQFTAHVELGRPGRHRLRVLDPDSGVVSEPFLLVIKG